MTIFTDDTGAKFEIVFQHPAKFPIHEGEIVIRPIKAEPKWDVTLFQPLEDRQLVTVKLDNISKHQAQLIKEACEALMEYITTDKHPEPYRTMGIADKAREALKGDES